MMYAANGDELPWPSAFPTWLGNEATMANEGCIVDDPAAENTAVPAIDSYGGGILLRKADTTYGSGDINCNGIGFELADYEYFFDHFLHPGPDCSWMASDVNQDGRFWKVSDLRFMRRVVDGEVSPYNPPPPLYDTATIMWNPVEQSVAVPSDTCLSGLFMVFYGDFIPELYPTFAATGLNLVSQFDTGQTKILVIADPGAEIPDVPFMSVEGALGFARGEMSTCEGQAVIARYDDITDVPGGQDENLPGQYALTGNYPNPFNPSTTIQYSLPEQAEVRIVIYNVMGQRVKTLVEGVQGAGEWEAYWDGRDESGNQTASGIYFYRMTASDFVETKKMILLK
jgi:hypothetical protein